MAHPKSPSGAAFARQFPANPRPLLWYTEKNQITPETERTR